MSALAATFADDADVEEAGVLRMLEAAAHRGPRTPRIVRHGPATLGHRGAHHDRSDQPFVDPQTTDAIVFDGRLDNRDELCALLGKTADHSDAALALAAYRQWSDAAPSMLLGDFALIVWDAQQGRLFCARDALGQRPLFYGSGARTPLVVASEPQQVRAHPAIGTRVNEGVIAEYLAGQPMTVAETVWADVRRLPPGHAIVASRGGVRVFRHWDFDPGHGAPCRDDEQYAMCFAELFRQAVRCRARDGEAVGLFLSGGVDSSAIAGMMSAGGFLPDTYSLTFPGLSVDETPYIDAVVAHWGLRSTRLEARPPTRLAIEREIDRYGDLPSFPHGAILDPLRARAAADVQVVLTGYGGDDWFTGSPLHTTDLLVEGRPVAALRQLAQDAALPGRGYTLGGLARSCVAPLLSAGVKRVLRPIAGSRPARFDWIRPEFASRVALSDRLKPAAPPAYPTYVQREVHATANSLLTMLGDEMEERASAAAGIEQRHPFNDRRVAEFGFALPESQRWHGGETKVLIRRALGSLLPEAVRHRNDKAEFSPVVMQTFVELGGPDFFARLRCADEGWIDLPTVRRMYDEAVRLYTAGNEAYIRMADAVWGVAAVELWARRG
jgi:asparagine synthase (glutamine-hydrolysing)